MTQKLKTLVGIELTIRLTDEFIFSHKSGGITIYLICRLTVCEAKPFESLCQSQSLTSLTEPHPGPYRPVSYIKGSVAT